MSRSLWIPDGIIYDEDISIRIPWRRGGKNALIIASDPRGDIPHIIRETEKLLRWLKQRAVNYTYLSPKEATCLRVLTEIEKGNYDIIHYAGHVNHSLKKQDVFLLNDGVISNIEVERSAKPCKIVFLSCCESAVGIKSFANAFLKKGAQIIIGSICKVNDRGTKEIPNIDFSMKSFSPEVQNIFRHLELLVRDKERIGILWVNRI